MKRSELNTLTIEKTKPQGGRIGKGFVLYGNKQEYGLMGDFVEYGAWLERWFSTKEKAVNYCVKHYQTFKVI